MVIYDLICEHEHAFEGWFKSEDDFKSQQLQHMLTCPNCDSNIVKKVPTASYIATRGVADQSLNQKQKTALSKQHIIQKLTDYIVKNTEDVGQQFAEEAKKIHYGETDKRAIRGQATVDEVKELNEEGIDVLPLPGPVVEKQKLN